MSLTMPVGVFADGTVLAGYGRSDLGDSPGLQRDTLTYSLLDGAGAGLHPVARLADEEYYTATIDGLGPVGDGAHAVHEHLLIDKTLERTALLTLLLTAPAMEGPH